jgi:hypothetical protein
MALVPTVALTEDFLGVPLLAGGNLSLSQEHRLEKTYDMPYDQLVRFYKDALKDYEYIKFWDRGDSTYIEDHLSRPWHSVTISKTEKGTNLVILKDNWTWIIGTLTIRFAGTFAVLGVLYLALSVSGTIISRTIGVEKKKKQPFTELT